MKKILFRKCSLAILVCVLALATGFWFGHAVKASAAVKCYTIGTANVQVYSNTGLTSKYGTIFPSDEITVQKVTDRYCKVTYPIARGTKTGYISTGKILTKTIGNSYTSREKITTYRRASNNNSYGYVAKGDSVKVLGASGNYTQVKYPVSGGYKYAFIKTTDLNAYILPNTSDSGNISNGTYKLVSALNNNYVMDVNGASTSDSANVQLYEDNGSNAQKFVFTKQSDGYYTLTCKCNGLVADVSEGKCANGVNIQMYTANGTAAQKWKLVSTTASNSSNSSATAQKIVDYELSQLGIGDSKGNNNVKYNTWYYGRTVSGAGYAWCMAFQSYCANQIGVLGTAVPKTASCAVAVNWYKNKGQFKYGKHYGGTYTPKAGDLVFYYSGGSFCHVGMITAPPVNGYLQTVEGNIQCSDGNWKVVKFTQNAKRKVDNPYVYGYGTPAY